MTSAANFLALLSDAGARDDTNLSLDVLSCISGHTLCKLVVPMNTVGLELKIQILNFIGIPLSQQRLFWGSTPVESATRLCDLLRSDKEASGLSLLQVQPFLVDENTEPDDRLSATMQLFDVGVEINTVIDGVRFAGKVERIERGVLSNEKLYLIGYLDGDCEHFTEGDMLQHLNIEYAEKRQLWKRLGLSRERFWRMIHAALPAVPP